MRCGRTSEHLSLMRKCRPTYITARMFCNSKDNRQSRTKNGFPENPGRPPSSSREDTIKAKFQDAISGGGYGGAGFKHLPESGCSKTNDWKRNSFPENPGRPPQLVMGKSNNISRCKSAGGYGGAGFERLPEDPGI